MRLRTLMRLIHSKEVGSLASRLPLLLPYPVCLPFALAAAASLAREREWMFSGFLITKPSLTSLRMFCLELAIEISLTSLGSNHTFLFPHLRTSAASLVCNLSATMVARRKGPSAFPH